MQTHPTESRPSRQDSSEKNPQFQFRGTWTPAGIHHGIIRGKISGRESSLLSIVEAFVEPHGKGCYACNAYLARSLNVSRRSIPRMIAKLKQLGLLRVEYRDGVRYLETCWSRAGELPDQCTNAPMTSTSWGDDVHVIQKNTPTEYSRKNNKKKISPRPPAPPARGKKVSHVEGDGTVRVKLRAYRPRSETVQPPAPPGPGEEKSMPAPFPACEAPAMTRPACGQAMHLAERYKALAARNGWPKPLNMRQWESCFAELLGRLSAANREKDLTSCLDWYEREAMRNDSVPVLTTPFKFSQNFEWLFTLSKNLRPTPTAVEVSEEARKIAGKVGDDFPGGCDEDLKVWAQESLANATDMFRNLHFAGKAGSKLANRIFNDLHSPAEFVKDWLTNRAGYATWASKKGRPVPGAKMVFRPDSPEATLYLNEIGAQAAKEYSGNLQDWYDLKGRIGW